MCIIRNDQWGMHSHKEMELYDITKPFSICILAITLNREVIPSRANYSEELIVLGDILCLALVDQGHHFQLSVM